MKVPPGLTADGSGALYMIEAVIAAIVIISTLACISVIPQTTDTDRADDLDLMSADLLHVLERSGGTIAHPGLTQAMSSLIAWEGLSHALESDLRSRMPEGTRACLRTPYGDVGDCPPDRAIMSVRPFLAYRQETGEMIECSLIVWRP